MFFFIPWRLRQQAESKSVPAANLILIAANVLCYLLGVCCPVGPGSGLLSILLYAFSHAGLWHLLVNMWTLGVFGNPLNRRVGHGYYLVAYLTSAAAVGLFARLFLSSCLVGASGAVFAVVVMCAMLMPRSLLELACVAVCPLTLVIGLLSRPTDWSGWLIRAKVYRIRMLVVLVLVPLMELILLIWWSGSASHFSHLLGMLCGLAAVLLLPSRVTMGRWSLAS
jgi:membrane associated rhomboid family serine protease